TSLAYPIIPPALHPCCTSPIVPHHYNLQDVLITENPSRGWSINMNSSLNFKQILIYSYIMVRKLQRHHTSFASEIRRALTTNSLCIYNDI
ncbi:hypothetical protein GIB67_013157, partial [Kingdonia uniflora]